MTESQLGIKMPQSLPILKILPKLKTIKKFIQVRVTVSHQYMTAKVSVVGTNAVAPLNAWGGDFKRTTVPLFSSYAFFLFSPICPFKWGKRKKA
jgi:hypothetical protein